MDILKGNFVSQTIQFMSTVVINFDTWSVQTLSNFEIFIMSLDVFKGGWVGCHKNVNLTFCVAT